MRFLERNCIRSVTVQESESMLVMVVVTWWDDDVKFLEIGRGGGGGGRKWETAQTNANEMIYLISVHYMVSYLNLHEVLPSTLLTHVM